MRSQLLPYLVYADKGISVDVAWEVVDVVYLFNGWSATVVAYAVKRH